MVKRTEIQIGRRVRKIVYRIISIQQGIVIQEQGLLCILYSVTFLGRNSNADIDADVTVKTRSTESISFPRLSCKLIGFLVAEDIQT